MFLKSIEIRGFKSFAGKTDLLFKKGVTAVVGPNGSGKSNISDAVRWVLGEQSAKSLRGGKMEDVIFAGTQFRKPVGLAQVSLTLDNADGKLSIEYSDVTVSRRLYRSGESEYYINNSQCRLRDVQELFMDTGIGKEGYSIIGQGKIDAILSGRPEERRNLLEEAAGIVKYKNRKEEAEKKLQVSEQNLVRIIDIVNTYEERIEPLKIENEKARLFLEISEELKNKEINLVIHSVEKIKNNIELLNETIISLQKHITETTNEKEILRGNLQNLNNQLEKFQSEIEVKRQYYYENKNHYQNYSSEIALLRERISHIDDFVEKSSSELKLVKIRSEELGREEINHQRKLNSFQEEQKAINMHISELEKKMININLSLEKETEIVRNLKNDDIEMLTTISNKKNNILLVSNDIKAFQNKLEQLKTNYENTINSVKINSNTKEMLEKEILSISVIIVELEETIKSNRLKLNGLNSNLHNEEKRLKDLNSNHNRFEANYQMLSSLDKHYEGYNKSVKTLMQHIDEGKIPSALHNCFILGETISVKKEFETAIEISLGGAISDIITLNEDIAKGLIKYLKDNNLGRATFLPLTIIKGRKFENISNLRNVDGYIGIASELVEFNNRFKSAVEFVLGRTIIAKDMESALQIAKVSNYTVKIVTLGGEVINPGGSLTGGSIYNKTGNIIGRKREIEELQSRIKELVVDIANTTKGIEQIRKDIKNLDENSLNLKDKIYYNNIEVTKIQGKISAINIENDKFSESLAVLKREIQITIENIKINEEQITSLEEEIRDLSVKEINIQEQIALYENKIDSTIKETSEIREKLTGLKIKKAQIDEVVANKIKDLERLSREIDEKNKSILFISEEIETSNKNRSTYAGDLKLTEEKANSTIDAIKNLEEEFKVNEIRGTVIKNKIKETTGSLENISLVLIKKEEEMHKHDLAMARLEAENDSVLSKLNDEYQLTYAEALKYKAEIGNMEEHKKHIDALKRRISSIGVVNLGAIEEYKEVVEKYTFLNTQKDDLIKAKNELIGVINTMTDKMKKVFHENFNILRKNFHETFVELFKGGRADLILSDGDELSSNIEINVELPGKKLQNINLMSGGEKVLSAIALLFAILKMKPTPFCILDEIEAALDDANVFRFADYLKNFSNKVQFIVITHRKGTMECSDALYGVTMEERGVSKIVSVDLSR